MRALATAVFCFSIAQLGARTASADNVPITEAARQHFTAGVNFLEDPDGARYEDAYREFKTAYEASPSWKILGNLGIAAMKLERDGEAVDAFTKYLAQSGKELDREERTQVERDLKTLQAGVVTLAVTFEPKGATLTDERIPTSGSPIVNRYGPVGGSESLGLRPGHHRLTVELEGHEKAVWEFEAMPKQQLSHAFTLNPLPQAPPPVAPLPPPVVAAPPPAPPAGRSNTLRIASYVSLGVGAVGLGLGTVSAFSSKSKYDEANEMCPAFPCQLTSSDAKKREDLGDEAASAKTLSIVGFVVGGVGVAAGVTLFVISGKKEGSGQATAFAPYVGPGTAGVRGTF
jgi:hypothetical protein